MSQNYAYPASSTVTITGSTNGTPIPNTSIVVGGENASGNTEPLQLDGAGNLKVTLEGAVGTADVNVAEVGGVAVSLGQKTSSASIPVVLSSDQSTTISSKNGINNYDVGFVQANAPVYNDYVSGSITTAAYVQLIASTTSTTREIEIFDSSGQALYLAIGGSGSEVNQIIIFPGGNGRVKLSIPSGTRVSAKAITGTANVGFLAINLYG